MQTITDFMASDHRSCDELLVTVEHAVADRRWGPARAAFTLFRAGMLHHFSAEEAILFPLFEQSTGIFRGPTQVMRAEHAQMRQLLAAAEAAVAAQDADDYSGNAETLLIMMQQHNVKEENVLYPMCDQHLAAQVATLLPELQQELTSGRELAR
ncbi:MAG TPA: hemerythrin domain-containing protein [Candidatus Accumulibacter phosphatis]|nr:MAG: iron-sulfur cluster repair di-iron protein [Candidatus Accumulibacter sp. SK-11]HAY28343.1 hemerythrin domain-containing protein [Accumulibacter sp.]HRL75925.1 hemerythrin domain-containing protein [Candidatus Accumulibacter phosphatis]HCN67173.1 hemerythrin domain-containing protein [Accumulibacter sp.]HCV14337.1 hemerythrin domain-containing protein [Accumulibacter sp.]